MLKEGWDVRNVSVILPMRPFGSDILVEQTLGRGLRRMFPHDEDADDALYVIEHPSFRDLWETKIKQQQLAIPIKPSTNAYQESNRVYVDQQKFQYNFSIPVVKGGISKIAPDISALEVTSLPSSLLSLRDIEVSTPRVIEERLRDKKIVGIWELDFDFAPTIQEYLAYITKGILKKSGSASQFAQLLPKVKRYIMNHMFEERLIEIDSETLKKLNSFTVRNKIAEIFVNALNNLGRIEKEYSLSSSYDLRDTKTFHTTNPVYFAQKTVFNCLPYPKQSKFERDFMRYLDGQREVKAYTKILRRFPIRIAYYDEEKGVRYYIPDFIVQTNEAFFLVETKGEMFDKIPSVKQKSKAGIHWCKNISKMTGKKWKFVKIRQDVFMKNRGEKFSRLTSL